MRRMRFDSPSSVVEISRDEADRANFWAQHLGFSAEATFTGQEHQEVMKMLSE